MTLDDASLDDDDDGDAEEPETVPEQLWRLDCDIDTLFDFIADHTRQLRDLTNRTRELETPTPARFPPSYFRRPLTETLASLAKQLADGIIDQATHDEAAANLTVADQYWRDYPDGYRIVVTVEDILTQLDERETRGHLHAVPEPDEDRPEP